MNQRHVLDLLDRAEPANLAGPALLARLARLGRNKQLTTEIALQLQPDIDRAIAELEGHVTRVKEVVDKCLHIRPSPSRRVPSGF